MNLQEKFSVQKDPDSIKHSIEISPTNTRDCIVRALEAPELPSALQKALQGLVKQSSYADYSDAFKQSRSCIGRLCQLYNRNPEEKAKIRTSFLQSLRRHSVFSVIFSDDENALPSLSLLKTWGQRQYLRGLFRLLEVKHDPGYRVAGEKIPLGDSLVQKITIPLSSNPDFFTEAYVVSPVAKKKTARMDLENFHAEFGPEILADDDLSGFLILGDDQMRGFQERVIIPIQSFHKNLSPEELLSIPETVFHLAQQACSKGLDSSLVKLRLYSKKGFDKEGSYHNSWAESPAARFDRVHDKAFKAHMMTADSMEHLHIALKEL
jgi:hypothetical protein